jgi:hypothetical protein
MQTPVNRALQRQLKKCLAWDDASAWAELQAEAARQLRERQAG